MKIKVNVPYLQKLLSKITKEKKNNLLWAYSRAPSKRTASGAENVGKSYGSEDPDPYQNATDPEYCRGQDNLAPNNLKKRKKNV